MSNKEERKAPVLRFKGFTDDWEQRKLKELAIFNPKDNLPEEFEYVDLESVIGTEMLSHKKTALSDAPSRAQRLAKKGDIFYQTVRPYQKNDYLFDKDAENYVFSTGYAQIRPKINGNFLFQLLRTERFVKKVLNECTGTSYPAINSKDLSNIKVSYTNYKEEQRSIGSLLDNLDNLVALQQRKLDQLKQLKRAYLSDLFSIKNKPQIRFKGFKGKWKKSKLLDNVSNIIDFRGKTPKKLGMDWSDQGILALSALNVKDGFIDKSIHAHYGDIKLYNKWMAGNKLHKGQVLFTTEAPMGNVAQVPDNDKYILSQRTIAFNVNKDKISDFFLAMLLQTTTVHNQLLSLSSGGTAKGVSQKSLSGLSVAIPLSLEEQRKMEMAFKYINHLIHFQQDKIRYLEENKQFLLQNMFI